MAEGEFVTIGRAQVNVAVASEVWVVSGEQRARLLLAGQGFGSEYGEATDGHQRRRLKGVSDEDMWAVVRVLE